MNYAAPAPKLMIAKFPGTCTKCNGRVAVGDEIAWSRATGARHVVCPERSEVRPEPQRVAVEDQGVYVMPDGGIVKVQANRAKTRTYAKRWVEAGGMRLTETGERVRGEYVFEAGLVALVAAEGRRMTYEEAAAFILRYGQCCRCGRTLKAAESVERGIGPVCVTYFRAE